MGMADKRRAAVEEFTGPHLQAGEQSEAVLSFGQTAGATAGTFGAAGALTMKHGAIVVTDQRVLLVTMSGTAKPQEVAGSAPRAQVKASEYNPGFFALGWKGLSLSGVGDAEVKFRVPRPHREEFERVLAALGSA